MTPTLVLTRPEAQSRALAARLGLETRIIVAPIMEIRCGGDVPELGRYAGVILTSANAVRCAPPLTGVRAHCVGERTAAAATEAGAEIITVARNADELVSRVSGPGPLVHLRGEHVRGNVAKRLQIAGIETDEVVLYRQVARPLSDAARRALEGDDPVVLPLYSPRSARLTGADLRPGPALHVVAMSVAVAEAWAETTGGEAEICESPTGEAMRARIVAALQRMSP